MAKNELEIRKSKKPARVCTLIARRNYSHATNGKIHPKIFKKTKQFGSKFQQLTKKIYLRPRFCRRLIDNKKIIFTQK